MKSPKVQFIRISPKMAKNWLEHSNPHNRALSEATVVRIVEAIKRGEWMQNGDSLRFDWDGNLLDGQHRLEAIVRTGKALWMVVISDLDPACFTTIDTGKKRNGSDVLSILREQNCPTLSCSIQMVNQYQRTRVLGGHGSARVSNARLLTAWETFDKEHMRRCVTIALRAKNNYAHTGILAACGYLIGSGHRPKFERIVADLTTATSIVANDPVPALLAAIKDARGHRIKLRTLAALTVQTVNARLRKQAVINLHWSEDEPFPALVEHTLEMVG